MEQIDLSQHVLHYKHQIENHAVLFKRLLTELKWDQIVWKGKPLPRLACAEAERFPVVREICVWVEKYFAARGVKVMIKGVWGNHYRDQNDFLPDHDHKQEVGPDQVHVLSLNFGATRRFRFKQSSRIVQNYDIEGGDIMAWDAMMNKEYKHGISKATKPAGPRINLTFFCEFSKSPYGIPEKLVKAQVEASSASSSVPKSNGRTSSLLEQLQSRQRLPQGSTSEVARRAGAAAIERARTAEAAAPVHIDLREAQRRIEQETDGGLSLDEMVALQLMASDLE